MSETAFFFPFSRSLSPLSFSSQLNAKKWAVPGCQAPSERDTQGQGRLAQRRAGRNSCTRSLRDEPAASPKTNLRHRPLRKVAPSASKTPHEPTRLKHRVKKKRTRGGKNPQDPSLHRRRLNKGLGRWVIFYRPPHAPFPAFPSLSSLLLSSIVVSLASRQRRALGSLLPGFRTTGGGGSLNRNTHTQRERDPMGAEKKRGQNIYIYMHTNNNPPAMEAGWEQLLPRVADWGWFGCQGLFLALFCCCPSTWVVPIVKGSLGGLGKGAEGGQLGLVALLGRCQKTKTKHVFILSAPAWAQARAGEEGGRGRRTPTESRRAQERACGHVPPQPPQQPFPLPRPPLPAHPASPAKSE